MRKRRHIPMVAGIDSRSRRDCDGHDSPQLSELVDIMAPLIRLSMPGKPQNQTDRPILSDPLSDILASTQLQSSALANFFFSAPFAVDCEYLPTGTPFHAVISGECQVRLPDRDPLVLRAGDLILLPRWSPHILA